MTKNKVTVPWYMKPKGKGKKLVDIRKVQPIRTRNTSGVDESKPVKGKHFIEHLYSNIYLAAKTNSGKTTVINHLLQNTIDRRTKVYIFASTINTDKSWLAIKRQLKRKNIECFSYDSIYFEGENLVEGLLKSIAYEEELKEIRRKQLIQLKREKKRRKQLKKEEKKNQNQNPFILLPNYTDQTNEEQQELRIANEEQDEWADFDKRQKKRIQLEKKFKTAVPERVIIFDDIAKADLRSNLIIDLTKRNRHYKARVIISGHGIKHINSDVWTNLYYIYLWKGFSREYIKAVWDRTSSNLSEDEFWELYSTVTKPKYNFLRVDMINGKFSQNFGDWIEFD